MKTFLTCFFSANLPLSIVVVIAMFTLPALVLWLTGKSKVLKALGPIAICYATGFVISLLPLNYDKTLTQDVASILVAVAIPLLLMTFDLTRVRYLAKKTTISFLLVVVATMTCSTIAYFVASKLGLTQASNYAGMATGLYVGGTPNLIAIGKAIIPADVADLVITAANTADFFVGGVYFFLLLTVLPKFYHKLLDGKQRTTASQTWQRESETIATTAPAEYDYKGIGRDGKSIAKTLAVVGIAVACVGVGALLEIAVNGNLSGSLFIMITVSVLGVALSFVKPIRNVNGPYQVGNYLILIFSLGLALSIDLSVLAKELLPTLLFFASVQVASMIVHLALCKLFKIDSGTAIITSTAGIYGPPFIAPIANAYGDKNLIAPGIICGTVGLATGNLLGIALGSLLAIL